MQQRLLVENRKPVRIKSASSKHRRRLGIMVAAIGAVLTVTALVRT